MAALIDDIEAFAAAAARLDAGGPDAWLRANEAVTAEAHWVRVLRQEALALAGDSLERYVRSYLAASEAAPTLSPTRAPDVDRPPSPPVAPVATPAFSPPEPGRLAAAPVQEVPSHLRATAALPAAIAVPSYLAATTHLPPPTINAAVPPPVAAAPLGRLTTMADPTIRASAATPFTPATQPAPPSARVPASPQVGTPQLEPQRGLTTAPGQISLETLPFQPARAAGSGKAVRVDLGMMPLERYAELAVALASGEPRESVLRRFVLTEDVWQAIAAAWGEKITGDRAVRARFDQLIAASREAAARGRRGT